MKEDLYMPNCIRTYTGKYIDVFNLKPEDIDIKDIAHALSRIPRFNGHLRDFYSVAEHSIACAKALLTMKNTTPKEIIAGLLHDASEAYLCDIPSPFKSRLPDYKAIEDNVMKAVALKFNFTYPLLDIIKAVDKQRLEWEWENLMLHPSIDVKNKVNLGDIEELFLHYFEEIQKTMFPEKAKKNYAFVKITAWTKLEFEDDADMNEIAELIDKGCFYEALKDGLDYEDSSKYVYNSKDLLSVKNNDDEPTIEVYQKGYIIYDNKKRFYYNRNLK